ncbi:MAG: hypothetical protein OJF61_002377 [Rhodanobacteraceae bacterium]|jgi:hypothetical protein|nr:MAG: hypothetical protein OJF61_002377 [Rhodanobacteraceae bacterium]
MVYDKVGEEPRDCKRSLLQWKQALEPGARILSPAAAAPHVRGISSQPVARFKRAGLRDTETSVNRRFPQLHSFLARRFLA